MKPLFRSLAIFWIAAFSQFGWAADLDAPSAAAPTQVAAAAQDLRMRPPPALNAAQLGVIDDARNAGSGSLRDTARAVENSPAEGLPSTPIALATLLLIICILIGRRNT